MPGFSRAQLGIILLLGAVLFGVYGLKGNFGRQPAAPSEPYPQPVFVEVRGSVSRPGVHAFPAPPPLAEVWRRAGGAEPVPRTETLLSSGSLVEILPSGGWRLGRMTGERLLTLGLALDLNSATPQDLEALPGIGPVLARRIIQHREQHGPFKTLDDLLAVPGIGAKKLAQLSPFLRISSP